MQPAQLTSASILARANSLNSPSSSIPVTVYLTWPVTFNGSVTENFCQFILKVSILSLQLGIQIWMLSMVTPKSGDLGWLQPQNRLSNGLALHSYLLEAACWRSCWIQRLWILRPLRFGRSHMSIWLGNWTDIHKSCSISQADNAPSISLLDEVRTLTFISQVLALTSETFSRIVFRSWWTRISIEGHCALAST